MGGVINLPQEMSPVITNSKNGGGKNQPKRARKGDREESGRKKTFPAEEVD